MQKITQENEFFRKNSATARFLCRYRRGHLFFIVDFLGKNEARRDACPFFLMQKRRFCKTQIAKLFKIIQKNAKKCRKICIYKKNVLSLQRVSEESRNEPQKVNQKTTKKK